MTCDFKLVCLVILVLKLGNVDGTNPTYSDFKAFLDGEPYASYQKKVFPRYAQTDNVEVDIVFQLVAITKFDELAGQLNIVGSVTAKWTNELLTWYVHVRQRHHVALV